MAILNVTAYGIVADPTGSPTHASSNVSNFQTLINNLFNGTGGFAKGGATFYFPAQGTGNAYFFNATVTIDNSMSGYDDVLRFSIIGDGMDETQIQSTNLGANSLFSFKGLTGGSAQGYFTLRDFRLYGELNSASVNFPAANNALFFTDHAYVTLENISVYNFGTGISVTNCYNFTHINLDIQQNLTGYSAIQSNGAAIVEFNFYNCDFSVNVWFGAQFIEASNINFFGGSIQRNGRNNYTTKNPYGSYGILIANNESSDASNGLWGATFSGVQFELNYGIADAYLTGSGSGDFELNTGFLFSGCGFLRENVSGSDVLAVNCVQLDLGSSSGRKTSLVLLGNSFGGSPTYTPSSSRPYVNVVSGGAPYQVTEWGNVWASALEMPNFLGPVEGPSALSSSRVTFNGTLSSPVPLGSAYNVASITKNSTGNYTINFQRALTDSNYAVTGSIGTTGLFRVGATTNTSVTVQITSTSGSATDSNPISVVTFGSNTLLGGT